jgi:hypothetical protein
LSNFREMGLNQHVLVRVMLNRLLIRLSFRLPHERPDEELYQVQTSQRSWNNLDDQVQRLPPSLVA